MKKRLVWLGAICLLASTAAARDLEDILKEKKIIDAEEANEVKANKEKMAAPALPALPDWVNKVTLNGDVRVRNELFSRKDTPDRDRQRFRLRFGAKVKVNSETEAGMRLASGTANDPISNNTTFSGTFSFKDINIANAYLKLSPADSFGWARPYFTLMGGKFDVPTYTVTNLMFDRDLAPEGFFESIKPIEETEGVLRSVSLNFGQWVFNESSTRGDGEIYAFQGLTDLALGGGVFAKLHVADYMYNKESTIAGARNANTDLSISNNVLLSDGTTLGGFRIDPKTLGPNKDGLTAATVDPVTGAAVPGKPITIKAFTSQFNVVNAGGEVTIATGMPAFPVKLFGDYLVNVDAEGPGSSDDTGWEFGGGIGAEKDPGDFNVSYAYAHLETDATPSTFSDSDFGRDGGTNTEGHIVRMAYVLLKNFSIVTTAWIVEPIDNVPGRNPETEYRWQFDFIGKF